MSGKKVLEARGHKLLAEPELRQSGEAYLNGSDPERLAELSQALGYEQAQLLWAVRGGYGLTRILPQLTRKPGAALVAGFSDVTALLWHLWAQYKKSGLHAPVLTKLSGESEESLVALDLILAGRGKEVSYPEFTGPALTAPISGVLMPGNLAIIAELIGTSSMPSLEGAILILEDIKEQPYRLDRMMTHLWTAGCLKGVAAVLVGYLTDCGEGAVSVIENRCQDFGIPCFSGFAMGHESPNWPVPLGISGKITAQGGRANLKLLGELFGSENAGR
jgi:muramoyltetrapeptide carboxypeptidase